VLETRVMGYPPVKTPWSYLVSFWLSAGVWQTDGRTDRQTDGRTDWRIYYG